MKDGHRRLQNSLRRRGTTLPRVVASELQAGATKPAAHQFPGEASAAAEGDPTARWWPPVPCRQDTESTTHFPGRFFPFRTGQDFVDDCLLPRLVRKKPHFHTPTGVLGAALPPSLVPRRSETRPVSFWSLSNHEDTPARKSLCHINFTSLLLVTQSPAKFRGRCCLTSLWRWGCASQG